MPAIASATRLPPPPAPDLNPDPAPIARSRCAIQTPNIGPIPTVNGERREHKGMLLPVARVALTYDHHGVVDPFRHGQYLEITLGQIARGVQVQHLAIDMQKSMHRSVGYAGKSDNMTGRVHAQSAALRAAECTDIAYALVRLRKGVIHIGLRQVARASQACEIVYDSRAAGTSQSAEVLHFSIAEKKSVTRTIRGLSEADHMAGGVHAVRGAHRSA